MNIFFYLLNQLGTNGPFILFFLSIFLLWNKQYLLFYYIIGFFFNAILNLIIKGIIKQPRPSEDIKIFNLALSNGKRFIFKNGIPHDIFGMPSGHSQSSLFSTIFIFLSIKKFNVLYFYLLFSLLIMIQRIVFNFHTGFQCIIGALIGTCFAYLMYKIARSSITGKINMKFDDFAIN